MPRDITVKQLRIVAAVCAFSLSIAQAKAEDRFLVDEGKAYAEIIISESPARLRRPKPRRPPVSENGVAVETQCSVND
jgi:hypothetical protein